MTQDPEISPEEFWASLTPERRLALAKAAPRILGPWVEDEPDESDDEYAGSWYRRKERWRFWNTKDCSYEEVEANMATVLPPWKEDDDNRGWTVLLHDLHDYDESFDAPEAAKSACDAELIRLGYVLEGDE